MDSNFPSQDVQIRKFEMYKTIYQKNKQDNISFNFISKVSVKFLNLRFGAVHSN